MGPSEIECLLQLWRPWVGLQLRRHVPPSSTATTDWRTICSQNFHPPSQSSQTLEQKGQPKTTAPAMTQTHCRTRTKGFGIGGVKETAARQFSTQICSFLNLLCFPTFNYIVQLIFLLCLFMGQCSLVLQATVGLGSW